MRAIRYSLPVFIARFVALFIALFIAGVAGTALTACSSSPPGPWHRESVRELAMTVEAVDPQARLIALRDGTGAVTTVYAGPEVRNFDQIKAGDEVVVSYKVALAAAVTTAEEAVQGNNAALDVERAEPGERPHAGMAASITATVRIDSVDKDFNTVTFHGDDGFVRTVSVEDEKAREFIRGLRQGDLVTVKYSEAVAVDVRPARAADDQASGVSQP
jgi:hypothetical protein